MTISINKNHLLNFLLIGLMITIIFPWKKGFNFTQDYYISIPEFYAFLLLVVIYVYRSSMQLSRYGIIMMILMASICLIVACTIFLNSYNNGVYSQYFANNNLAGEPEKPLKSIAIRFPKHVYKQHISYIDNNISFSARGIDIFHQVFPLYFLNDEKRFSGKYVTKEKLPVHNDVMFSAKYFGFIDIPEDSLLKISVKAGKGVLKINGTECSTEEACSISVNKGFKAYSIEYQRLKHAPPSLELCWLEGNNFVVVPKEAFYLENSRNDMNLAYALNSASYLLVFFILLRLFMALNWKKIWISNKYDLCVLGLCFLGSIYFLYLCYIKGSNLSSVIMLPGNDWLAYETQARAILNGDWLNSDYTDGKPFYWNVGYRYLLAGLHYFFGENPLRIVFYQYVLMIIGLFASYKMIKQLFSLSTGIIFIILVLLSNEIFHYPRNLLDTTFSILTPWLGLLLLCYYNRYKHRKYAILASIFFGIAIIIRANFLPFLIFSSAWVYYVSSGKRILETALYIFCPVLLLIAIGIRNFYVAGEFIVLPSSGGHNLWLAHRFIEYSEFSFGGVSIPNKVDILSATAQNIINDLSGLIDRTQLKFLHIMGFKATNQFKLSSNILIMNVFGLVSALYLLFMNIERNVVILMLIWIGSVILSLLIIFPWGYGFRLQSPTFLPLIFIVTIYIKSVLTKFIKVCMKSEKKYVRMRFNFFGRVE